LKLNTKDQTSTNQVPQEHYPLRRCHRFFWRQYNNEAKCGDVNLLILGELIQEKDDGRQQNRTKGEE